MKKFIYVANWKMTVSPEQASRFYTDNKDALCELAQDADIILCPSFAAISNLFALTSHHSYNVDLFLGAQNCSEHTTGAFTGEVDALSLKQIGCDFCIVGHSERRTLFHETNNAIAGKVQQLLTHGIIPIVCIGETLEENKQHQTFDVLTAQLNDICSLYAQNSTSLVIAYEPVWAIGTGIVPTVEQLTPIIEWIKKHTTKHMPHTKIRYVYGGSVNPDSVKTLKTIAALDGFLIGGASSDFQTFKNIVV